MIYISMLGILIPPAFISIFSKKKFILSSLFMTLVMALIVGARHQTGTDYNEYLNIWMYSPSINDPAFFTTYTHIEPGFKLLIELCKAISAEPYVFFFINSCICFSLLWGGLYRLSRRYEFNICLSLFIYCCLFLIPYPMNAMRQALVMSLFLFTIPDIIDRKLVRVLLISLIGYSIHSTSIFILLTYFLFNYKGGYKNIFICTLLSSVFLLMYNPLTYIAEVISPGKYALFKDTWGGGESYNALGRFITYIILSYISFKSKNTNASLSLMKFMMIIYSLGFVFYFAFFDASMLATRINMFFRVLEILIVPIALTGFNIKSRMIIFFLIVVITLPYYYVASINPQNQYNTFFHN
ncbi:EpsG family protein [Aeromonas hydrophila]|uniref:EpsG family protein n=1 Tax=Aeromonas hydrophila TaxID=644 RepID=UPI001C5A8574|nr:EpsG family protein [Aeromonas hydrophila]MBW3833724.1 hypothetical protein [Aeromonas hydrophila]MBW5265789.1 hypothetical protein [Aeromonas hydrophila]MBW5279142.1 hypothetical protein [Aeromonas hydrophila]